MFISYTYIACWFLYSHVRLRRLSKEGEGFKIAMGALDGARLSVGACSVGAAQMCFEIALKYVKVGCFPLGDA
jgi:hypothetical protein